MDLETIRAKMAERGIKRSELGRLLGLTRQKTYNVFAGKRAFSGEEMALLYQFFGMPPEPAPRLLKALEEREPLRKRRPEPVREIPVVGLVAAGKWQPGTTFRTGRSIRLPDPTLHPDVFAVTVEGDSMDLVAPPGCDIVVDPSDRELRDGKYYVVRKGDGDATFKRYLADPPRLEPCSSNPEHRTIQLAGDDVEIIGRVIRQVQEL